MSNIIDFFQPVRTQLALPGVIASVLVDGSLCPFLELVEVVRSGWPEFGWARLAVNEAAYPGASLSAAEEIEGALATGKRVSVLRCFNGLAPGTAASGFPMFDGQIEGMETVLGADGVRVEVVAKDSSANLERITVYGQRVEQSDGSTLHLSSSDTVFNPDGEANATAEPLAHNGNSYTMFAAEPSAGKLWSCAEVIEYLLCEYLSGGQLQTPSIEQLRALTDNQEIRDLDVTGSSLLDALHRCSERVGLEFKFVSRPVPTGPRQTIVFYRPGESRVVELNCQYAGEQLSISKTNIARLGSKKGFWPVTHKYIGQGDFKVYEATFDLVKAWDPADEDTDYDKFSPSTNAAFYQVKDVYRKWCLNEAGDYSGIPFSQGEAFDFSKIFGSGNFVSHRRRFWPALTADKQGESLGYYLEVSFDNGLHWWQYLYAFNNLLDECGVWLSSDQLDVDTWVAALKGVLKFRMTASVVSDERISCEVADGPVDSVTPVVEHLITRPSQFRYSKVSGQSVFAGCSDESLGTPDEVDDATALYEFVRKTAELGSATIETVDVQTPYLVLDYEVNDVVTTSPESRDLLSCRSDNRSVSWIEWVRMDFRDQSTDLKIVRKRMSRL
jgi:hypothetical protein